jgi:hypothetical protein
MNAMNINTDHDIERAFSMKAQHAQAMDDFTSALQAMQTGQSDVSSERFEQGLKTIQDIVAQVDLYASGVSAPTRWRGSYTLLPGDEGASLQITDQQNENHALRIFLDSTQMPYFGGWSRMTADGEWQSYFFDIRDKGQGPALRLNDGMREEKIAVSSTLGWTGTPKLLSLAVGVVKEVIDAVREKDDPPTLIDTPTDLEPETVIQTDEFDWRLVLPGDEGQSYAIQKETILGRGQEADIAIDDVRVSRQHAMFEVLGGRLRVTDLNSSNGTFVNQRRIAEPNWLDKGDIVLVGDTRLVVQKEPL